MDGMEPAWCVKSSAACCSRSCCALSLKKVGPKLINAEALRLYLASTSLIFFSVFALNVNAWISPFVCSSLEIC